MQKSSTGFIDPVYGNGIYWVSKIVLKINKAALGKTRFAEQKLSEKLDAYNIEVIKFTDIVLPTRTYIPAEEAKLLAISGADSVLTI